ncbi:MAG: glycosyltransferase family 61 protein, partial [Planctomycetota bacterium]
MLTPAGFHEPVVLELADFRLPTIPEPPDGVILRHNVWLCPGASGLYDAAGQPIVESFLRRGFDLGHYPHGRPDPVDGATLAATAADDAVKHIVYVPYAGMTHFGHLLTEFAGNIGALLENPGGLDGIGGVGSVLVVPARAATSCAAVAKLLGLPANRLFSTASLTRPVQVVQAVIPRPSMMNRHGIARRHFGHVRRLLSRLYGVDAELAALAKPDRGEKLYLSRSRLSADSRHILAEEDLERELAVAGWRIVYPEQLPLAAQLDRLAAARTIVGGVG